MSIHLISATDLIEWAEKYSSPSDLAVIVGKLMRETDRSASVIGFRDEKGVHLRGWDGIVENGSGIGLVPSGTSYWELSTSSDSTAKLNSDYEKRSANSLGAEPSESSLVMLSLRRIPGKDAWVSEARHRGPWAKVHVYDADDLCGWLSQFVYLHIEVSRLLRKLPFGVYGLEAEWEDWSTATRVPITNDLVLAGRGTEARSVVELLNGEPTSFFIKGETVAEAIAAVGAALQVEAPDLLSRCVIVDSPEAWHYLIQRQEPMVLIARLPEIPNSHRAVANGHHVVVPLGLGQPAERAIELPRIALDKAREVLRAQVPEGRLDEMAQLARHSIGAYRRRYAHDPDTLRPDWAKSAESARQLMAAIFLSQWKEGNAADMRALAKLAGRDVDELKSDLHKWTTISDPPLRVTRGVWRVAAPSDSWAILSSFVEVNDLRAFADVAVEILGEADPRVKLSADDRMVSSLTGTVPSYSDTVRRGVARTLAVLGAQEDGSDDRLKLFSTWAAIIVKRLLDRLSGWETWASLDPLLPLMAEAAPREFLAAVSKELAGGGEAFCKVMEETDDRFFGRSNHTGLLWGLEKLAWSNKYLTEASLCLARLHLLDRRGRTANRPMDSLYRIFLLWLPCTAASLEERLEVLNTLRLRVPQSSWLLLMKLLPQHFGSTHDTDKPDYRDWVPESRPEVTYGDIWEGTTAITKWAVEDAGEQGARWAELVEQMFRLPKHDFDTVLAGLQGEDGNWSDDERSLVWNAIRRELAREHEEEVESSRMPAEVRSAFAELLAKFEPRSPRLRHRWIFDNGAYFEIFRKQKDQQNVEEELLSLGKAAIEEILALDGLRGVVEFASSTERPDFLGSTLGQMNVDLPDSAGLLQDALGSEDSNRKALGSGLIAGRMWSQGKQWLIDFLALPAVLDWNPELRATLYFRMEFEEDTWKLLGDEPEEVQATYWRGVQAWPRRALTEGELSQATEELERQGRLGSALQMIGWQKHHKGVGLRAETLVALLEQHATAKPRDEDVRDDLRNHTLYELIEGLEKSGEVAREVIGKLQYMYLGLFLHYRNPPWALYELLGEDPKLFVDLLSSVFKAEGEESRELSKHERSKWSHHWKILHEWSLPPGVSREGKVDGEKLTDWLQESRRLAKEIKRAKVADQQIGGILAHFPKGEDGIWPHGALREALETVASDDLELGLELGVRNSRGVTSRSPYEGGQQERDLAAQYRDFASKTQSRWPRITRVLQSIADSYEDEARQHDDDAQLTQDGLR